MAQSTWKWLVQKQNLDLLSLPTLNAWLLLTTLNARCSSEHIFGASSIPRCLAEKLPMSPSSTINGGRHDKRNIKFELLLIAAFVIDGIQVWCFNQFLQRQYRHCYRRSCLSLRLRRLEAYRYSGNRSTPSCSSVWSTSPPLTPVK